MAPLVLTSVSIVSSTAYADESTPQALGTRNNAPLVHIFGLPRAQPAKLLTSGSRKFSLSTALASSASQSLRQDETIVVDAESTEITLAWQQAKGRWQWGVELPFYYLGGGFLDSFIDSYHDTFSLPEGERPKQPRDNLMIEYRSGGATQLLIQDSDGGVGDIKLELAYQWLAQEDRAIALRTRLKLPTGDSDKLLGSGGVDFSLGIDLARRIKLAGVTSHFYAGAGVLFSETGDVLPALRRNTQGYGHLGLGWQVGPTLSINLQFDGHSEFYDSDVTELEPAMQLTLGGHWQVAKRWRIGFAVIEDVIIDTVPDVAFQMTLEHRL